MLSKSIEKKVKVNIIYIVKKSTVNSQASIHFQLCLKYLIPFHNVVPSNFKLCNGFKFSHSSSLPAIIASHFVEHSLVEIIFTHMYLKVSIGPYGVSQGFYKLLPLEASTVFPHISP